MSHSGIKMTPLNYAIYHHCPHQTKHNKLSAKLCSLNNSISLNNYYKSVISEVYKHFLWGG